MEEEQLIRAIRDRVLDPEWRVDARPSEFFASVQGMSLGQLFSAGRAAMQQAMRAARGDIDEELVARAEEYGGAMNRPAVRPMPPRATPEALDAAEERMGISFPPLLRRLYTEVANGGFGPGYGLIGVAGRWTDDRGRTIEDLHAMLSGGDPDEPSHAWPVGLVPVVEYSPAFACVDTSTADGRVVDWDPEEIDYRGWHASFTQQAASIHEWLETWVRSRPAHELERERIDEVMAQARIDAARKAREAIGRMSLQERRAMGLPDEGWENEVMGGIGLESDEEDGSRP